MAEDKMKPQGAWQVRRKIRVPALGHPADGIAIERSLTQLSGILQIRTDNEHASVQVLYDITQIDFNGVSQALSENGFPPLDSGWERFKAGWYQYLDSNGRDSANAPAPPCCSNPKGITAPSKRPK